MRPPRIDYDAALWFAVAYFAAAFGILPVLLAGLALTGAARLDVYVYANAGVVTLAFAIAAGLLTRQRPERRFRDMVLTLWVLGLAASAALAVLQFVGAPRAALGALLTLAAPLTLGFVQLDSVAPVTLGPPDPWALVGVLVGLAVARLVLRARGRKVGEAAEHGVTPMRLR